MKVLYWIPQVDCHLIAFSWSFLAQIAVLMMSEGSHSWMIHPLHKRNGKPRVKIHLKMDESRRVGLSKITSRTQRTVSDFTKETQASRHF